MVGFVLRIRRDERQGKDIGNMEQRKLGKRGPVVSVVGFGAWAIGGMNWGPTDDAVSKRAVHSALDAGCTLIDTADVYGFGHSEELVAQVLRERGGKGNIVVATKAGSDFYQAIDRGEITTDAVKPNYTKDYLIGACERSLKRLELEAVDILQLHSPGLELLERDDPWEALDTLKRQGKIRHAGLSVQSFKETEQAHLVERHGSTGLLDVIQVRYNLLEREAEKLLFPNAIKFGVGVIVRIPLLFGLLTGKFSRSSKFSEEDHRKNNLSPEKLEKYLSQFEAMQPQLDEIHKRTGATAGQIALAFTISHPACHTVIPGGKTPEQVADNVGAAAVGRVEVALP
jgi:aryl-alcohol dehydrogenase-like predicted oxidoreductase